MIQYNEMVKGFKAGASFVWYMNDDQTRDFGMGLDFIKEYFPDKLTNLKKGDLSKSHTLVAIKDEKDKEKIFVDMQGENWSPNGEQREFLGGLGIHHTSMMVGDIIAQPDGFYMVDHIGFQKIV